MRSWIGRPGGGKRDKGMVKGMGLRTLKKPVIDRVR
jgi:hypothetical protein